MPVHRDRTAILIQWILRTGPPVEVLVSWRSLRSHGRLASWRGVCLISCCICKWLVFVDMPSRSFAALRMTSLLLSDKVVGVRSGLEADVDVDEGEGGGSDAGDAAG